MSDATEAIIDIQEALDEYGSDIVIKKITKGVFNPTTGEHAETIVTTNTKALITSYTSLELQNSEIHADDLKFMIYTSEVLSYNDNITFDSQDYKILNIDKKVFQNLNLYYIIQGRA